ncbi:hypothetical protein [Streptomyces sp. NPDC057889]
MVSSSPASAMNAAFSAALFVPTVTRERLAYAERSGEPVARALKRYDVP